MEPYIHRISRGAAFEHSVLGLNLSDIKSTTTMYEKPVNIAFTFLILPESRQISLSRGLTNASAGRRRRRARPLSLLLPAWSSAGATTGNMPVHLPRPKRQPIVPMLSFPKLMFAC